MKNKKKKNKKYVGISLYLPYNNAIDTTGKEYVIAR
jgi:hypothetical protein